MVTENSRRCREPCQERWTRGPFPRPSLRLVRAAIQTRSMFAAFRSRNYAVFWTGSFLSNVGTWMQTVALGWLIYEMTGSASWLGTVSFAANAPTLFLGLVGGAIAHRADR